MFVVIFEVKPRSERWNDYLQLAGALRPELERIDGFIDNERFASRARRGWILSLSTWRDEKAVVRWRTLAPHHFAQARGRTEIFEDYHLRVGEIVADSNVPANRMPPCQRLDETEVGLAKAVTISVRATRSGAKGAVEFRDPPPGSTGVIRSEAFFGIAEPSKELLLLSWRDMAKAVAWQPGTIVSGAFHHRAVRIIRDYGMQDRREAPQYYPALGPPDNCR
jgi:heme-degrading monooxygenase HmoA